jgi:hypothetical protein
MAATTQIPREAWRSYFEELTDLLGTEDATVEVVGRDVGDQIEEEQQILTDITYEDESDTIIVGLESVPRLADGTDRASNRPAAPRPRRRGRTSASRGGMRHRGWRAASVADQP